MELNGTPLIKRYNYERQNARWTRDELDTRFFPDEYGEYFYAKHLENSIEHPTIGMLAMHEAKNKPLINYPHHFTRNQKILENESSEVKLLAQTFNDIVDFVYPRTKKIREFIIKNNRIDFDTVKKSKGYNWLDKLKLFMK